MILTTKKRDESLQPIDRVHSPPPPPLPPLNDPFIVTHLRVKNDERNLRVTYCADWVRTVYKETWVTVGQLRHCICIRLENKKISILYLPNFRAIQYFSHYCVTEMCKVLEREKKENSLKIE